MAVASPSSPKTLDPKSDKPDASSEKPNPDPSSQSGNPNPDPNPNQNANPNANPNIVAPPPPSFAPSFRPLGAPPMPQYSAVPNPNPSIQPPGVSAPVTYMIPGVASGAGSVTVSAPPMRYPPPGAPPMAYGQVPNGYMTGHPPGIPRYPGPYPPMIRPGFPPRPLPPMGVIPQILRPPIPGIRGPPVVSPVVRPVVPAVATEKPQTTVYVSKIAPTVDNDFLLSLLRLCGPVKSWKRAQNPSDGSPTSFGFCEFEAAEGILRALRLLTKLNIDGQELGLKINQATREYLERYVQKKTEQEKLKATENQAPEKENEGAPGVEKQELQKPAVEGRSEEPDDSGDKENQEHQTFGIVTDEDREADKDASEKITSKIEERRMEETKALPDQVNEDREATEMQVDAMVIDGKEAPVAEHVYDGVSGSGNGEATYENSIGGELTAGSAALTDMKQNNDVPARKLGFGLMGSGKRTTVPSVFREEDENVEEKKMRPLVPIDYSTEELQAVQSSVSSTPPNLVAAAEFAKRISGENSKEEKPEMERNRNGRSNDRSSHKERVRNEDENARHRNDNKEKTRDRSYEREREREDKPKSENKKLLDAKQLIDMIPKTKEELFAYEINWDVYDKHELHEKMRPWISKKITEFLGEEEETLVDYIVSSTKEHVQASKMLNLLKSILDDEAEMFVLKMWRMLIFEIKRVETGISVKPRA
ncbi:uncharacterized protein A4U43_C05F22970 [Asparagus officinalis]|uniref:PWI domain-containing protein n=1 Tax=Asparagus officinalis TaxID=4686 RepID=A0A5P1ETZ6_ASPOF|nr:uncharacterized protein A4U43_C05F22970 [Asparagus officinalis]